MKCDKLLGFIRNEIKNMAGQDYPKSVIEETTNDYYSGDNPVCQGCDKLKECYPGEEGME